MCHEVPEGAGLGQLLFLLYKADIKGIALCHAFLLNFFADDTQLQLNGPRENISIF